MKRCGLAALSCALLGIAAEASAWPDRLQLRFEENRGQADPCVRYLCRTDVGSLLLTDRGAVLGVVDGGVRRLLELSFPDSSASASMEGEGRLPGVSNYLIGEARDWIRSVPSFARVRYREISPGVDLVFRTGVAGLEYDLEADARCLGRGVEIRLEGADALAVDDDGALVARLGPSTVRQPLPAVFDPESGRPIEARWVLLDRDRARIELGAHDPDRSLVVDPVIAFSTFLGGTGFDEANAVAIGPGGSIFVAGVTLSLDFPVQSAAQVAYGGYYDAFVAALDPSGSLIYATYLGGSAEDRAYGVAVDGAGQAVVVGSTRSTDFPQAQPAYAGLSDAFVAKLGPSGGSLVWSRLVGGGGDDVATAVAVDGSGDIHVVGSTTSSDLPLVLPLQGVKGGQTDAFVAQLPPQGTPLRYLTYLGGHAEDEAAAVATDALGNTYVAGSTWSDDFPTQAPLQTSRKGLSDAFVTSLSVRGTAINFSTYLGGGSWDDAYGVAVDGGGRVWLVGSTASQDFPTVNALQPALAGQRDGFVARLAPQGSALQASTYVGGSGNDYARSCAADPNGSVFVAGSSSSRDFPAVEPLQNGNAGSIHVPGDAFVTWLDGGGTTIQFSTLIGGSADDGGAAVCSDGAGSAVVVGSTSSLDFPIANAVQPTAINSAFVTRIDPGSSDPSAQFTALRPFGETPVTVTFEDNSAGQVVARLWSFGDGTTSTAPEPAHTYWAPGAYTVQLTVSGPAGSDTCVKQDLVQVVEPGFVATPDIGLPPLTVSFTNTTAGPVGTFRWSFGDGTYASDWSPVHTFGIFGQYQVSLEVQTARGDAGGWYASRLVNICDACASFVAAPRLVRPNQPVQFTDLSSGNPTSWGWKFGDGATSLVRNPVHAYANPGLYEVSLYVTGPAGVFNAWTESGYILVTEQSPATIVTGPGPDPAAPPRVLAFDVLGVPSAATSIYAYGTTGYGANVAIADLDGAPPEEIVTGPGPSPVFGPHVRAFTPQSVAVPGVSFYAYGTLKYGVLVAPLSLDGSGKQDVLAGAGPGVVFGPHVRGFTFGQGSMRPLPGLSFFAYSWPSFGVNVAAGRIDATTGQDILTAPGPGPSYGPLIRGFRYGPPLAAIPGVFFYGLSLPQAGARVGSGDGDHDGYEEILVGGGPGVSVPATVRIFDFDGAALSQKCALDAFGGYYGAEPHGGDLDGDGVDDLVLGRGADPGGPATVAEHGACSYYSWVAFEAYPTRYGVHVAPAGF